MAGTYVKLEDVRAILLPYRNEEDAEAWESPYKDYDGNPDNWSDMAVAHMVEYFLEEISKLSTFGGGKEG